MTISRTFQNLLIVAMALALFACGHDDGADAAHSEKSATESVRVADTDASGDGAWFSIDEAAGTVTMDEVTYPIAADGTLMVDGVDYDFVIPRCPVPDSGLEGDIIGFHAVGYSPDGRPFNFNGGAPTLAVNITWDADWRSTNTAHDIFGPDWTISDRQMRADDESIKIVATGEKVPGSIVVTCR